MNSHRAPYSRRDLRLFLGAQASLPGCFDQLVCWLIVTGFLLITSPSLFAQTNDNTATVGGRIAGQARTPALPGTDSNGNFAFAASNGARYRLIVSAVGFAPISREVESVWAQDRVSLANRATVTLNDNGIRIDL